MTPEYFDVTNGEYDNEQVEGRPYNHEGATPGKGSFNFAAGHYADDFSSYGTEVGGKSESSETTVDAGRANRGKES